MEEKKNDLKNFDYSGTLSTSKGGTLSTSNDNLMHLLTIQLSAVRY